MEISQQHFDLDRFIIAQTDIFELALAELLAGTKRSHWMWFIFPQMRGLGASSMAQKYGIVSLAEAKAYLIHPILGQRLKLCTGAVLQVNGRTLNQIFGSPDDMKFRSSMTLFACAGGDGLFRKAIDQLCNGEDDPRTATILNL